MSVINVVGISCCPTGIAHTYMSAEAVIRELKEYGIKCVFEKQGQLGTEDELDSADFANADAIVLCCGITPEGEERYQKYSKKVVEVDYNEVVGKPEIVIVALKAAGLIDNDLVKIKR